MPASTLQLNQTNAHPQNNNGVRTNVSSIPLLILNSVPQQNQDKDAHQQGTNSAHDKGKKKLQYENRIVLIIFYY